MSAGIFRLFLSLLMVLSGTFAVAADNQVDEILSVMADHIGRDYPLPEIAHAYTVAIDGWRKDQRFSGLDECVLARRLTDELQVVHRDLHLSVVCTRVSGEAGAPLIGSRHGADGGFQAVELDRDLPVAYIRSAGPWELNDRTFLLASHVMGMAASARYVIIDVRGNPGGHGEIGRFIASYFFPEGNKGELYLRGQHRDPGDEVQKLAVPYVPGQRLNYARLFILIDHETTSAAEGFAFGLQHMKRATIIGQNSAGAGITMVQRSLPRGLLMTSPIELNRAPDRTPGWEGTGVIPDIATPPGQERAAAMAAIRADFQR